MCSNCSCFILTFFNAHFYSVTAMFTAHMTPHDQLRYDFFVAIVCNDVKNQNTVAPWKFEVNFEFEYLYEKMQFGGVLEKKTAQNI